MGQKTVIIRIHQGRIWFNENLFLSVVQTNLPVKEIDFEKIRDIYWLLEQTSFDKTTNCLTVKIVDYFLRNMFGFMYQNPKAAIRSIVFSNLISPSDLKNALKYYSQKMPMVDKAIEEGLEDLTNQPLLARENLKRQNPLFRSKPEQEKFELNFDIWFKDAEFKLGYITFDKNIPELKQMLHFQVNNDFLLPEFEFIKGYFIKALGTRKFDVKARITLENGKVSEVSANSKIIMKINESLIDSIKNVRTYSLTRAPFKGDIDKSLFTSDDIFDEFGKDGPEGNVFSQSEEEILRNILEKFKVRNRKQLEYLSGARQAEGARLRFTLHPYFGFLFTVEGEKMNHFIWELLNSHATYIWSLDKGEDALAKQYRRVEDAINRVRNSGRDEYKRAYHASHIDQDLVFHVINHEDAASDFIESFVKWRHRLGEVLV